jgi:NitT/TauT family transport system substrate-binding protein
VSEKTYNERKTDLCELGRQWYRTLDYIAENKKTAYEKMGSRIKSTGAEYQEMMRGLLVPDRTENKKLLSGGDPALFQSAKRLYEIMLRQKLVENKADIISIIDPNYQDCTK